MSVLEKASENLAAVIDLIEQSTRIAGETRLYLKNQSLIYSNYLSSAIAGLVNTDAEMMGSIEDFCSLIRGELAPAQGGEQ